MFIKVRSRFEYVCSDDVAFNSKEEAEEHEYELIRDVIYKKQTKEIGDYIIYVINNKEELKALENNPYGESTFILPRLITFPLILGEISNSDGYYRTYKPLDDIIESNMNIVNQLIKFMEDCK